MTASTKIVGLGFALAAGASACGTTSNDPCDGATSGTACRWAGITGVRGFNGEDPTANRLDSRLDLPLQVTFGPDGRAIISDYNNHRIRRVEKDGSIDVIMGNEVEGDGPPDRSDRLPQCAPPGAAGPLISLNHPTGATFGPDGMIYIAAWHDNKIRVIDPDTGTGYTLAGVDYGFSGDTGLACLATFNQPKDIVFDAAGDLFVIDQRNVRIREISPGTPMFAPGQTITTYAGVGPPLGNGGDGGPAIDAQFGFETIDTPQPSGALVIKEPYMYVADSLNNRIRRIDMGTGIIDCIANASASPGYSGDGGPAIDATFNYPQDMRLGPDGNTLFIADRYNHAIRSIDLTTNIVNTVAGNGGTCNGTACPDRGDALAMGLNEPQGVSFDATGNMYIVDTNNYRILKVFK